MLIYRKYFTRNIFSIFFTVTFAVTTLVWITQILKLLYLLDKGIPVTVFLNLIILVFPSLLFVLLPIITTIAIIYTYHELNTERQLITLQVLGVNNLQLASPAIYVSLLITLFAYYLSNTAVPSSYINLKTGLMSAKNTYISGMIEEKTFNAISKDVTLYIDKKLSNQLMSGIIVFDNRNASSPSIVFAKSGRLILRKNNPIFALENGIRQAYDENNNLTQLIFNSLVIQLNHDKNLTDYASRYEKNVNEYYIQELLNPDPALSEQKKNRLISEAHQRIIWPLYNFVLPFVTLAVFFRHSYSRKITFAPILSTIITVLLITSIHFVLQNFSSKNLSFIFYCYLNILAFFTTGLYLFISKNLYR